MTVPYKEIEVTHLVDPTTKQVSAMTLVLKYRERRSGYTIERFEKPSRAFYSAGAKKAIKSRMVTSEMKEFASEQARLFPVPDPGKIYRTSGKIMLAFIAVVVLAGAAYAAKVLVVDIPQAELAEVDFYELPQAGDRYFGLFTGDDAPSGNETYGWAEVTSVSADGSLKFRISTDLQGLTFNPDDADSTDFAAKEYSARFSAEEGSSLSFVPADGSLFFTSTIIGDEFDKFKRSAG